MISTEKLKETLESKKYLWELEKIFTQCLESIPTKFLQGESEQIFFFNKEGKYGLFLTYSGECRICDEFIWNQGISREDSLENNITKLEHLQDEIVWGSKETIKLYLEDKLRRFSEKKDNKSAHMDIETLNQYKEWFI